MERAAEELRKPELSGRATVEACNRVRVKARKARDRYEAGLAERAVIARGAAIGDWVPAQPPSRLIRSIRYVEHCGEGRAEGGVEWRAGQAI